MADDNEAQGTRELTRTCVRPRPLWKRLVETPQIITVTDNTAPVGSVTDASVACADYDAATEYGA